jgi:hypothetical protein
VGAGGNHRAWWGWARLRPAGAGTTGFIHLSVLLSAVLLAYGKGGCGWVLRARGDQARGHGAVFLLAWTMGANGGRVSDSQPFSPGSTEQEQWRIWRSRLRSSALRTVLANSKLMDLYKSICARFKLCLDLYIALRI